MEEEFQKYVARFNLTEDDLSTVEDARSKMIAVMKEIIEKSTTDETKRIDMGILTIKLLNIPIEEKELFICPRCDNSLIDVGITEILMNAIVETDIYFGKGQIQKSSSDIHDFDDQWVVCLNCGTKMHDRTAEQIIEEFEKEQRGGANES